MKDAVLDTPESFIAMVFEAASAAPWRTLEENVARLPRPPEMEPLSGLFDNDETRAGFVRGLTLFPGFDAHALGWDFAEVPLWPPDQGCLNVRLESKEGVPSDLGVAFARACEACAQAHLDEILPGARAALTDVVVGSATFRLRLDAIAEGAVAGVVSGVAVLLLTAFGSSATDEAANSALQREVARLHHVCVQLAKRGGADALACYTEYGAVGSVPAEEIAPRDPDPAATVVRRVRVDRSDITARGTFIRYEGEYFFRESKSQHISRVVDPRGAEYQEKVLYRVSGIQTIGKGERLLRIQRADRVNPPRLTRSVPQGPEPDQEA